MEDDEDVVDENNDGDTDGDCTDFDDDHDDEKNDDDEGGIIRVEINCGVRWVKSWGHCRIMSNYCRNYEQSLCTNCQVFFFTVFLRMTQTYSAVPFTRSPFRP